jgi:hypothetical protein
VSTFSSEQPGQPGVPAIANSAPATPVPGVCSPPHPGNWIFAPLPPHCVPRVERRGMSLDASHPTG